MRRLTDLLFRRRVAACNCQCQRELEALKTRVQCMEASYIELSERTEHADDIAGDAYNFYHEFVEGIRKLVAAATKEDD